MGRSRAAFEALFTGAHCARYAGVMRPLRYAINVTLDGCVDHQAGSTDEELHRYWGETLARADGLLVRAENEPARQVGDLVRVLEV